MPRRPRGDAAPGPPCAGRVLTEALPVALASMAAAGRSRISATDAEWALRCVAARPPTCAAPPCRPPCSGPGHACHLRERAYRLVEQLLRTGLYASLRAGATVRVGRGAFDALAAAAAAACEACGAPDAT